MSTKRIQEGAAKGRVGSVPSTVAKCLVCATVGGVGVLLPATAAMASTSGSSTVAAVSASPSVVTAPCATVQNEEGLVGAWGIGGKATEVLPNTVDCASDYTGPTSSTLSAAMTALQNADQSGNWEYEGGYPSPASLRVVTSDLTRAASDLNSVLADNRSSSSAAYLVEAEQWVAYTAFDIDYQYRKAIGTTGAAGTVGALLSSSISSGETLYQAGNYVAATNTFLSLLPLEYALDAPPAEGGVPCLPYPTCLIA